MPKLPLSDSRVTENEATVNGHSYYYLLGKPSDAEYKETIFLIHGWPDLSVGWRYQIPVLLDLGYRVVCPDMMGYGGTSAPHVPPESIHLYGYKRAADDIAELARQLQAPQIILGGHDWGGLIVWRTAQWHPDLVSAVFSICTPFSPQRDKYIPLEALVAGPLPQFGYQSQLAGGEVEKAIDSGPKIRQFLNALYGGAGADGERGFNTRDGVVFDKLDKLKKTPLLSDEELDYYTMRYERNGLHGTLNWYRTGKANYEDEVQLQKKTIDVPSLFIAAAKDNVLKPEMSEGMEAFIPKLTRHEVKAHHWAHWETKNEVNQYVGDWLKSLAGGGSSL